jgi:hypothetical protein
MKQFAKKDNWKHKNSIIKPTCTDWVRGDVALLVSSPALELYTPGISRSPVTAVQSLLPLSCNTLHSHTV